MPRIRIAAVPNKEFEPHIKPKQFSSKSAANCNSKKKLRVKVTIDEKANHQVLSPSSKGNKISSSSCRDSSESSTGIIFGVETKTQSPNTKETSYYDTNNTKRPIPTKPIPTGHMISVTGEITAYFPSSENDDPSCISATESSLCSEDGSRSNSDSDSIPPIETFDTNGSNSIITEGWADKDDDKSTTVQAETKTPIESGFDLFWNAFKTFCRPQVDGTGVVDRQYYSTSKATNYPSHMEPLIETESSDSWVIESNSDASFDEVLSKELQYHRNGTTTTDLSLSNSTSNPAANRRHTRKPTVEMTDAEFLREIRQTINVDKQMMESKFLKAATTTTVATTEDDETKKEGQELSNSEFLQVLRQSMNDTGSMSKVSELSNAEFLQLMRQASTEPPTTSPQSPLIDDTAGTLSEQVKEAADMSNSDFLNFMRHSVSHNGFVEESPPPTRELSNSEFLKAMQMVPEDDLNSITYKPPSNTHLSNAKFLKALQVIADEEDDDDDNFNIFSLVDSESEEMFELKRTNLSTIEEVDSYSSHSTQESDRHETIVNGIIETTSSAECSSPKDAKPKSPTKQSDCANDDPSWTDFGSNFMEEKPPIEVLLSKKSNEADSNVISTEMTELPYSFDSLDIFMDQEIDERTKSDVGSTKEPAVIEREKHLLKAYDCTRNDNDSNVNTAQPKKESFKNLLSFWKKGVEKKTTIQVPRSQNSKDSIGFESVGPSPDCSGDLLQSEPAHNSHPEVLHITLSAHAQTETMISLDMLSNLTGENSDVFYEDEEDSTTEGMALASGNFTIKKQGRLEIDSIKKEMMRKEIGQKLLQGWTMLNTLCPHCVLPLLSDLKGGRAICLSCGFSNSLTHTNFVPLGPPPPPPFSTKSKKKKNTNQTKEIAQSAESASPPSAQILSTMASF